MAEPKENQGRGQRTAQVFDFAAGLKDDLAKKLREIETVVTSAAILAFSEMPVAEQLGYLRSARERHISPPVTAGA
ncbi:MAG TPA: hypothetical protein VGE74_12340 [Gemmata sp.]